MKRLITLSSGDPDLPPFSIGFAGGGAEFSTSR